MAQIRFLGRQNANPDSLQHQILSQVIPHLHRDTRLAWEGDIVPGPPPTTLSFSPNNPATIFASFDLADRRYLQQANEGGGLQVNGFQHVFVPGEWHRRQLLANRRIFLPEDQIAVVGAPRLDLLRVLMRARDTARRVRPRVLLAPLHTHWRDKHDVMTILGHVESISVALADAVDLKIATDPRNLMDKVPVTRELIDADVVITDYTSLMYEAWALGKPVIFPRWLTGDRVLAKAPDSAEAHVYRNRIGHHAASLAELVDQARLGPDLPLGDGVGEFIGDFVANAADDSGGRRFAEALERIAGVVETRPAAKPAAKPAAQGVPAQPPSDIDALIKAKAYGEADRALTAAVADSPDDLRLLKQHAYVLQLTKDPQRERAVLSAILRRDAKDAEARFRMGDLLARLGRQAEAADAYAAGLAANPRADAKWFYRLGLALEELPPGAGPGDWTAARAYARSGALQPERGYDQFGVGVLHAAVGRWDKAAAAFAAALATRPADARLRFKYGHALDRCFDWAGAAREIGLAIALEPDQAAWHHRLGFVLERMDRPAEASLAYAQAIDLAGADRPEWRFRAAVTAEQSGDYAAALRLYRNDRRFAQSDAVAEADWQSAGEGPAQQIARSRALRARGELDQARVLLSAAATDSEAGREALEREAKDLLALQQRRAAAEAALAEDCTRPETWLAAYASRAEAGDLAGAASAMQQAIWRTQAHEPRLYHELGDALARLGRTAEACAAYRTAQLIARPHGVYGERFKSDPDLRKNATYREFFDTLPVDPAMVMYEAFGGESISDNPLGLYRFLSEQQADRGWLHVWVISDLARVPASMRARPDVIYVTKESEQYLRFLCTAKYLVNNATFPSYFVRRPDQVYLATWHGTPFKTLGYDIAETPLQRANTARNFLQASLLIAPNAHTESVLLDRYGVRPLFAGTSACTGYPRIDLLINASEARKAEIRSELGLDPARKVVLYAPTYRGHWADPQIEANALVETIRALQSDGYDVIFRGHYFAERAMAELALPVKLVPYAIDTCELLSVVDVLVTDYSSIFYDFLVTGRPIIHYVFDWDYYVESRGLYFGEHELPGLVCRAQDALIAAVDAAVADPDALITPVYRDCVARFSLLEDGQAAARVAALLFDPALGGERSEDSRNLVVYTGDLETAEAAERVGAILTAAREEGLRPVALVDRRAVIDDGERTARAQALLGLADVLIRFGAATFNLEEAWVNDKYVSFGVFMSEAHEAVFARAMAHEVRRLIGAGGAAHAADLDGTRPFWSQIVAAIPAPARTLFLKGDFRAERAEEHPQLQRTLAAIKHFDRVISPSDALADANGAYLRDRLAADVPSIAAADVPDFAAAAAA